MLGQQSKRRQRAYENESLRHLARANTVSLIQSLEQIALSRLVQLEEVKQLATAVASLSASLKARKVAPPEAFKRLEKLMNQVSAPAQDGDIIRASQTLLERGWGKPALEPPEPSDLDVDDTTACEVAVRRAMLAKALSGDVTAQQVWLKLPTTFEVTGGLVNLTPDALKSLSDAEVATFTAILEKLRKSPTDAEGD